MQIDTLRRLRRHKLTMEEILHILHALHLIKRRDVMVAIGLMEEHTIIIILLVMDLVVIFM